MPVRQNAKQQKQLYKKHFMIGSFFVGLGVALGVAGLVFVWAAWLVPYHRAAKIAEMTPIRELIIGAVEGLYKDVAIDPKTGDSYIPEAGLYVPATNDGLRITYGYVPAVDNFREQINISSTGAIGQKIAMLHAASNVEQMFNAAPALQKCARGFTLVYDPITDQPELTLFHSKQLSNGKTLYIYSEQTGVDCQGFEQIGEALKTIQSFK